MADLAKEAHSFSYKQVTVQVVSKVDTEDIRYLVHLCWHYHHILYSKSISLHRYTATSNSRTLT